MTLYETPYERLARQEFAASKGQRTTPFTNIRLQRRPVIEWETVEDA